MLPLSEQRVTIVGLGLMGGSLAMDLRGHVAKISGVDLDADRLKLAKEIGLIDSFDQDLEQIITDSSLLILAVPVRQILEILDGLLNRPTEHLGIIDLGSTKNEICRHMSNLPEGYEAVGGHPICGREKSGLEAAESGLYRDEQFVLCRTERTSPQIEDLANELVTTIGAKPLWMSPEEHDLLLATSSHLPYLTAALLMKATGRMAESDVRVWQVSASGLRDTTRLAGSNPQMMHDIIMTNNMAIGKRLQLVKNELDDLIAILNSHNERDLLEWLLEVNQLQHQYRQGKGNQ